MDRTRPDRHQWARGFPQPLPDPKGRPRRSSHQSRKRGKKGIKILYEDPFLVVIDKPSGLLTVTTPKELRRTAHSALKDATQAERSPPSTASIKTPLEASSSPIPYKSRDDPKPVFPPHSEAGLSNRPRENPRQGKMGL